MQPRRHGTAMRFALVVSLVLAGLCPAHAETKVLDELKAQFNKDHGVPRLILLVSPT